VDKGVVSLAQADEVAELGLPAVGPVDDVVSVRATGVAAGELAAVAVAFADGAAERGRGLAGATAHVENGAGGVVDHGADGGVAADERQGAEAESQAVLDVAAHRVGRVRDGQGTGRTFRRFRVLCRRVPANGLGAGVNDYLIRIGVLGRGRLGVEVVGADLDEGVGEVLGRFHA
jgi:hypothetical protein